MSGAVRDERPAPTVFHAGVIVPAELTAELAAALEEYLRLLPAERRGGRVSRPVAAVLLASREAAAQHQARQHAARAWAAPTPVGGEVLGPAQLPAQSGMSELISTAQAADLAGFSSEWWRRLAVDGKVRGQRGERRTWLLWKSDVIGYPHRSEQETHRGTHSDQAGTGP